MTVREVVLHHDVRAPVHVSARALAKPHVLRRMLGVAVLLVIDVGALLLAVYGAVALWRPVAPPDFDGPDLFDVALAVVAMLAVFVLLGLYGRRPTRHGFWRILRTGLYAGLAAAIAGVFTADRIAPMPFVITWGVALALLLTARMVYDWGVERVFGEAERLPVVLVGTLEGCTKASEFMTAGSSADRYRIVGIVPEELGDEDIDEDTDDPDGPGASIGLTAAGSGRPSAVWTAVGPATATTAAATITDPACLVDTQVLDHVERVIVRDRPAELVVCDVNLARACMTQFLDLCERHHVTLKLAAVDLEFGPAAVAYVPGFDVPVFVAKAREHDPRGTAYYLKRIGDLVLGATLLVILSPLFLAIALAIKLTSRGPVFYVDERIGFNQRRFRCYKFRTMRRDAAAMQAQLEALNEAGGAIFKIRNDPRVTRVGRFLRKTSLDELPQLINVVKRDMSLVGPRPLPVRDFKLLCDAHKGRHVVLPGMTGLWQVSGRSDLPFDQMIDLDMHYIETWSLATDFMIVVRTFGVMLGFRGAY